MRVGAVGSIELSGRAGVESQQCRAEQSGAGCWDHGRQVNASVAKATPPLEGDSRAADSPRPVIRRLGLVDYEPTWREMQRFTNERDASTPDEIWFLEHPPVYTLGMNASPAHVLAPGDIPVVQIDRGGQVTYHGPGQLVVYPLIDLRRAKLGVRDIVTALEKSVIQLAAES